MNQIKKEQINNLKQVLNNGFRTSKKDFFLKKLTISFSELTFYKYCIPLTSATAAIHTALSALEISKNDEVIISSLTMSAPLQAVLMCGAKPIFSDIEKNNLNLSFKSLEDKITYKTKAIIIVNIFGLLIDYKKLKKILSKNKKKIYIIEDNAECIFGKKMNKTLMVKKKFVDFCLYSFQSSKIIKSGEGGMLCTNNKNLIKRAKYFSNLGYKISNISYKNNRKLLKNTNFNRHYSLGINYRMPELCAAVLIPQIKKIDKILYFRTLCGKKFNKILNKYSKVFTQDKSDKLAHSYWAYPILFNNSKDYKKFIKTFHKYGGDNFYGAWKIPYKEPFYKKYYDKKDKCLVAENIQKRLIQLNTSYTNLNDISKQARALNLTLREIFS